MAPVQTTSTQMVTNFQRVAEGLQPLPPRPAESGPPTRSARFNSRGKWEELQRELREGRKQQAYQNLALWRSVNELRDDIKQLRMLLEKDTPPVP